MIAAAQLAVLALEYLTPDLARRSLPGLGEAAPLRIEVTQEQSIHARHVPTIVPLLRLVGAALREPLVSSIALDGAPPLP